MAKKTQDAGGPTALKQQKNQISYFAQLFRCSSQPCGYSEICWSRKSLFLHFLASYRYPEQQWCIGGVMYAVANGRSFTDM